ncbi:two-component system, sensor histidine kinase and response regulator [Gammaproteobacteria bacterium]
MASDRDHQKALEQALRHCEAEPIHQIGQIQPHGALLVLDNSPARRVLQASENLPDFLDLSVEAAQGQPLASLLGATAARRIEQLIQDVSRRPVESPVVTGVIPWMQGQACRKLQGRVFASGDTFVLEWVHDEDLQQDDCLTDVLSPIQEVLLNSEVDMDSGHYFRKVAEQVRALIGFDRVMIYRFDTHWDGEVIAEDRATTADSYLGLRFPASDIPPQARRLYSCNLLRLVADIEAPAVPVWPVLNPVSRQPLDMTYSALRSLSPVHIEYLHNMGVRASLSISLLQNGRLWGLIACHHRTAKRVPTVLLEVAAFMGKLVSGKLSTMESLEQQQVRVETSHLIGDLLKQIMTDSEESLLRRLLPKLLMLFNATGVILVIEGKRHGHGRVPEPDDITALLTWLGQEPPLEVFACDHLEKEFAPAGQYAEIGAGVLVAPRTREMRNGILWFRSEKVRTVRWAGNAEKNLQRQADGRVTLSPRQSFDAWTELWRGHAAPWSPVEVETAGVLGVILIDALGQKRRQGQALSQRRQAEETLREAKQLMDSIVGNIPVMVFLKRASDLRFELFNRAGETLLGYAERDLLGKNDYDFFPSEQADFFVSEDRKVLDSPQAVHEIPEETITRSNGEIRYLYTQKVALRDQSGQPSHLLGISLDITERKQAEDRLRALNQDLMAARNQAQAANHAKGEFLANMSHEIRTPMNAILGLSEVLARSPLTTDQQDCVDQVLASGRALLGILNDILDYSKIEAGQLDLEEASFSLERLLQDLGTLFSIQAKTKSLEIQRVVAPDVPAWLVGDSLRLRQILINLTGNAIKFTEKGEVMIQVSVEKNQAGRVVLRFEVRDTGIGIAEDAQLRLFVPFNQADNSTTRRFGGTGLGLAISQRLVKLMGGEIGVESVVDQGSTFWFTVSLAVGEAPADAFEGASTKASSSCLAGLSILIVEDNPINQEVARRLLELEGAQVRVADHGLEALNLLQADPAFDLVLMDIQMPVMSGYEATQRIRSELGLRDLPILALTAGVMLSDRQEALNAGMNDFISKPFEVSQLISSVARHCGRPLTPTPLPQGERGFLFSPPLPLRERGQGGEGILFDPDAALKRAGGNRDLLTSLLRRFREQFATVAEDLTRLLETGEVQEAIRQVHTLRGVAGNLGAMPLAAHATRLETLLRAEPEGSPAGSLEALARLVEETLQAMDAIAIAEGPPLAKSTDQDSRGDFDWAEFQRLLAKQDAAAIDLFEAWRESISSLMAPESFVRLAGAIDDLDFRSALRILSEAPLP